MLIEADFSRKTEQSRMALARSLIEATIARYVESNDQGPTVVPHLGVARVVSAIAPTSYLFEPSLCISARGSKRVLLGDATYVYDEAHFLLTAIGRVGYESATQFNREYRRLFGAPPIRDVKTLRSAKSTRTGTLLKRQTSRT